MNKASHTILPPPAHSRRAAHFLKPLPIAALAALLAAGFAPQAWAITGATGPDGAGDYKGTDPYKVTIDSPDNISGTVYGNFEGATTTASDATVTMKGGTVANVTGGYFKSHNSSVVRNAVTLLNGSITGEVRGGHIYDGLATKNTVTISDGSADGVVYGGFVEHFGFAKDNTVTISSGTAGTVVGGHVHHGGVGDATGNAVTVSGGKVQGANLIGGAVEHIGNTTGNTVTISDGTVQLKTAQGRVSGGIVFAGMSGGGDAAGNTVNISGGTVHNAVSGGEVQNGTGNATGNTVTISDGTVKASVLGGFILGNNSGGGGGDGSATGNTVTISGGTVEKDVYGGQVNDAPGDATGNTVTLAGGAVTGTVLGGECDSSGCDDLSGNTLAVQAKDLTVGGRVGAFEKLAFTLPADIKHGDTMLTASGSAAFPDSAGTAPVEVTIAVVGHPVLKLEDTITLIAANSLTIGSYPATVTAGGYQFTLSDDGNNLTAKLTNVLPTYTVKGAANPTEGGSVDCGATEVAHGGNITCTATANPGYTYDDGSIRLESGAATVACSGASCKLANVTSAVTVSATFTKASDPTPTGGGDSSSPTMGELGLLLSGLALAGAAAPALRRRERKARKQD